MTFVLNERDLDENLIAYQLLEVTLISKGKFITIKITSYKLYIELMF